jgi:transposase-like protein
MTELNAENLETDTTLDGQIVLEPQYCKYIRENGYRVEDIHEAHTVESESSEGAHLVLKVESYEYPMNHPDLDLAAHERDFWVCDCGDFTYRKSVDVSEKTIANQEIGQCKHIEKVQSEYEGLEKCEECGTWWERLGKHQNRDHSDHMDSETLGQLYWIEEMTLREVAKELDTDSGTISRWLERFGIEKRTKSEAQGGHEFEKEELKELYKKQNKSTGEIAQEYGLDPSTVSRKLQKHGIEAHGDLADADSWLEGKYWDYGPDWQEMRQKRLEKDNEKCVVCGMTIEEHLDKYDKELCVHHIIPRSKFVKDGEVQEEANHIQNLVTLCESHHRMWEGIPLRPNSDSK